MLCFNALLRHGISLNNFVPIAALSDQVDGLSSAIVKALHLNLAVKVTLGKNPSLTVDLCTGVGTIRSVLLVDHRLDC